MLSGKAIQALRPDPERPGTKHHDRDGRYLWVARSGSKTLPRTTAGQEHAAPSPSAPSRPCGSPMPAPRPERSKRKQAESCSRPFSNIAQAWFEHHQRQLEPPLLQRYAGDT
jgi:hypothetical protein